MIRLKIELDLKSFFYQDNIMRRQLSDKMQQVYDKWQGREELPLLKRKHRLTFSMASAQPSSEPYPQPEHDEQERLPRLYGLKRVQSL